MQKLTKDQFEKLYGTATVSQFKSIQPSNEIEQSSYASRVGQDFKQAGQDILSNVQSSANQISQGQLQGGIKGIANQVGGVIRAGLGTVAPIARGAFAPVMEAPVIKQATEAIGGTIAKTDTAQKVASFAEKYPQAFRDLGNIIDIATLGLGGAVEKPLAGAIEKGAKSTINIGSELASNLPRATEKLYTVAKESINPVITAEKAAGEILQGKTSDLFKGLEAIKSVDTKGVKTFAELNSKLENKIPELAKVVDSNLAQDTTKYSLNDLATIKPTKAGGKVSVNYIDNALNQLDELYAKTGDTVAQADIKDLINTAKTQGLTRLEVNDIARTYGQEFGDKAFSKLGDPLTSVNAQMFENTRRGLKEVARTGINSTEAIKADKLMSSIYNTKTLIKKNVEAVNKLKNKIEERGLLEKIGHGVSKYADILSGGSLRGIVGGILPRGAGYKTLNALDLEELLQRNLKIINEAGKAKTTKSFKQIVNQLFERNSSVKNTLSNTDKNINQVKTIGNSINNANKTSNIINESIPKKPFVNKQGGFISTNISKDLQPLYKEAQKYKSAEEFVKLPQVKTDQVDKLNSLLKINPKLEIYTKEGGRTFVNRDVKNIRADYVDVPTSSKNSDNGLRTVKEIIFEFEDGTTDKFKNPIFSLSDNSKSQLEQIWKEANGKVSTKQGMTAVNPLTVGAGVGAGAVGINKLRQKK